MHFAPAPRSARVAVASLLAIGFASLGPAAQAAELLIANQASNKVIALDETTGKFIRDVTTTGLDLPSSLSWGPGGFLYAANFGAYAGPGSAASVVKIDPLGGATTPFVDTVAGPGAVGYDPAHDASSIWVSKLASFTMMGADFNGNEVYRYDATGTLTATLGAGSPATGRSGIAFDAEGDLYVSEFKFFDVGSVLKYDAQNDFAPLGTYASGAGVPITGPPGAFIPSQAGGLNGLAFDASGALYAAALTGTAVVKFTPSGEDVTGAQADGPIAYPSGLLVEESGTVLITSLGNNNASDPYYPGNTFPGTVLRYHPATNAVTPLLVGDANRDNVVDEDDLPVIAAGFGVDARGDFDGDADTDGDDFLLWQRALGNQSVPGSFLPTGIVRYVPAVAGSAAVPEPAAAWLAGPAIMGLPLAARRRLPR